MEMHGLWVPINQVLCQDQESSYIKCDTAKTLGGQFEDLNVVNGGHYCLRIRRR